MTARIALPDAEALVRDLGRQIAPSVQPTTALIGIHTGGVWIAERLHRELGLDLALGTLDVSFYRDDFEQRGLRSQVRPSTIPFEVDGRDLILIDDVLYTGRTIRAAMNELFDYGRPASIRLAALIDRGGRELPIAAQFVGARIEVDANRNIELKRGEDGRLSLVLNEDTQAAGH
ncbi:MAG: bifunctional pyr operon transcriptional regulator/uracil phosphoribosyltransferase PyrR [Burkholderiales bacterium]|nr:bifunctional pyr operon transcriptional regulator/uracil phosphoribosyltransferase PyrR [Burkholderiales bacterium]